MPQTRINAMLLVILGFIYLGPIYGGGSHDDRCSIDVETTDLVLTLSPSSDYCDQSSTTITGVKRASCSNNGDDCTNSHYRPSELLLERLCVPKANTTVSGTTVVTGAGGCSKTVTYRFANITECECRFLGTSTQLDVV